MNIITGLPSLLLSLFLLSHSYATQPVFELLYTFGSLSLVLGITNALPIPALDGSYPLLYLLELGLSKRRALQIIQYLVSRGMLFVMTLNIILLPMLYELMTNKQAFGL
jgi:membrane-associated protease RseP (regulator of RpoE activity)